MLNNFTALYILDRSVWLYERAHFLARNVHRRKCSLC